MIYRAAVAALTAALEGPRLNGQPGPPLAGRGAPSSDLAARVLQFALASGSDGKDWSYKRRPSMEQVGERCASKGSPLAQRRN